MEMHTGQIDGRIVRRLEGLFNVQGEATEVPDMALVTLLWLRGPAKP